MDAANRLSAAILEKRNRCFSQVIKSGGICQEEIHGNQHSKNNKLALSFIYKLFIEGKDMQN